MKSYLKSSTARLVTLLAFFSFATVSMAQFDVRLNGRVDFATTYDEPYQEILTVTGATPTGNAVEVFANETILETMYNTGAASYVATRNTAEDTTTFSTNARVDVNVANQTEALDYGAFTRLDLDADAKAVTDVDAHIYIKGSFGKLKFGTDIDAFQTAFDTDHISAGPMSTGKVAALGGTLDGANHGESSIVYSTPTISGVRVQAEIDTDSNWGASASYRTSVGLMDLEAALAADQADLLGGYLEAAYGDARAVGFYMTDDDKEKVGGLGLAYRIGSVGLSVEGSVASSDEVNGISIVGVAGTSTANITSVPVYQETDVVLGASYDLGPGLELSGSVGITDHDRLGQQTRAQGRMRLKF